MRKTSIIVGLDEAGRGPLAGPVVAGACVFTGKLTRNHRIRDSKQMREEEREAAYAWIVEHCVWGVGMSGSDIIDSFGILEATERAMHQALSLVEKQVTPTYLLIDGRDHFWFDYPSSRIIRGDSSEVCISAASIIAKVTRDRLMVAAAAEFPVYGFEQHKGYGTSDHFAAIQKLGPCSLHRQTFLKKLAVLSK